MHPIYFDSGGDVFVCAYVYVFVCTGVSHFDSCCKWGNIAGIDWHRPPQALCSLEKSGHRKSQVVLATDAPVGDVDLKS